MSFRLILVFKYLIEQGTAFQVSGNSAPLCSYIIKVV